MYLIDFGSSKSKDFNSGDVSFGSVGFCAPEQYTGRKLSKEADIYALGKMLEFMLGHSRTGRTGRKRLLRVVSGCIKPNLHLRIHSTELLIKMVNHIQQKDLKNREKRQHFFNTKRIGVMSMAPGEGATHVALTLASCLADELHYKVCYAEMNTTEHIAGMCHSGFGRKKTDVVYEAESFDLCLRGSEGPESNLNEAGYEKVVLDFGSDRATAMAMMKYCDIRIVVGPAAPWRSAEYEFLKLMVNRNTELKNWFLLVNPAGKRSVRRMEETGIPMFAFPYVENPFYANEEVTRILRKMIR